MGLLRRLLHLERKCLSQKAELARKEQQIMALIDDNEDLMRRYSNLLNQCVAVEVL